MLKKNKNLAIIALIALVNMLGYGIIIPILYSYSKRFGLSDFQNGLLFASFSFCQFIATPIIGRLSDKYGRRPMLLLSIGGTCISFFIMAFAPNYLFLFFARMLDGITAGNIPVAFAVISDSTDSSDRPRAFGIAGAALNFGFVFGPAISAVTIRFGVSTPFIIAALVTLAALVIAYLFLEETNKHIGEVKKGKIIDIKKLYEALFEPNIGVTFLISLLFSLAFSSAIIYGFQPFTINILKLTVSQNAQLFTLFGVAGLLTQTFLIKFFTQKFGLKMSFSYGILLTAISFVLMYFASTIVLFTLASVVLAVANGTSQTLVPAILSRETDDKSQGSMMGLNSSYQSIGMILGPIIGGAVATFSVSMTFLLASVIVLICYFLSFKVLLPGVHKESAY